MRHFVAAVLFLATIVVFADQAQDIAQIHATITRLSPKEHAPNLPAEITATPIPGVYEVIMGASIAYFAADGRYMLVGDLIDTQTAKNLSATRRNSARRVVLDAVGEANMFVFAPEKTLHTIDVFTDIDCGYCRKLHRDIKAYNDNGIKVRYLMFPRAGKDSKSYQKAVSAWCARDRNIALTRAKNGEEIDVKECANPVQRHVELGESMGITGTPTIITPKGEILPGYVPAIPLVKLLKDED